MTDEIQTDIEAFLAALREKLEAFVQAELAAHNAELKAVVAKIAEAKVILAQTQRELQELQAKVAAVNEQYSVLVGSIASAKGDAAALAKQIQQQQ